MATTYRIMQSIRSFLRMAWPMRKNKRKKRRKPWIRYERKHSLTAVHLDWHTSRFNGKEVCVVLDDSSRFILAGSEFQAATYENSIDLVRKTIDDFGEIRRSER